MAFSEALTDSCGLRIAAQLAEVGQHLRICAISLSPTQPLMPSLVSTPCGAMLFFSTTVSLSRVGFQKLGETGVCVCLCPAMTGKLVRPVFVKMFHGKKKQENS